MSTDRSWMYNRVREGGIGITDEFKRGVKEFVEFALDHPEYMSGDKIRCPCFRCRNQKFKLSQDITLDLYRMGFTHNYTRWLSQGEPFLEDLPSSSNQQVLPNVELMVVDEHQNAYRNMVIDLGGSEFDWSYVRNEEEQPNPEAQKFFDMLKDADEPLYDGCKRHTKLSAVSQLLNIKAEANMSEDCYNRILSTVGGMLPDGAKLADSFYTTKKMVTRLGLGLEKIDACYNDCMLYYKENRDKRECLICGHLRYKPRRKGSAKHKDIPYKVLRYLPLTPRLQRLYLSSNTAEHMRWHSESPREQGVLSHPADGEAWKHFDRTHPTFASEPRNVRLVLSTDGFNPFGHSAKPYSCWPVIVTPYNLPPWMCLKQPYMFLTLLVPGPQGPGRNLDVYLAPLIDELKQLWEVGVNTFDKSNKQNFQMRAALMWTVSDFPAYGMLSGWSTHGTLSCSYCMNHIKSFKLESGGKPCFFDCHRQFLPVSHPWRRQRDKFTNGRIENDLPPPRLTGDQVWDKVSNLPHITFGKKSPNQIIRGFGKEHNWVKQSIFWDLPYWRTNLIRHNLDVMHIEKNVFDNVFNTVMDVKGKTKDSVKARVDLKKICKRPNLELREVNDKTLKPKATYSLTKEQQRNVLLWIKELRLPDGYASNMARCVNLEDCKMYGMKSHDCHVFLERLLPIAFRDLLPEPIWNALTELSQFFRDLCSTVLREEDMRRLEENIVITLCKLEKIFPPAFFDSMEHLPIHLAYEAKVGGPVQYRWMHPFERFMHYLKKKVKNKACVEGSICEAYLIEETSTFCSHYFGPEIETRLTRVGRNENVPEQDPNRRLSVFTHPGRAFGPIGYKYLSDKELAVASMYVLLNCKEVTQYVEKYESEVRDQMPNITESELASKCEKEFNAWFARHVADPSNGEHLPGIKDISRGPHCRVKKYNGYFVNGYKFHTHDYGSTKSTMNSGVCIKGSCYNDNEQDYYGMLVEILELEYLGENNKLVLFKCDWYDYVSGISVHSRYNIVDVNHRSRIASDEPFVLALQAQQVYYTRYPYRKQERDAWWVVCKTKARSTFDIPYTDIPIDGDPPLVDGFYQEDEMSEPTPIELDNELDDVGILTGEHSQEEEVDPADLPKPDKQFEKEVADDGVREESQEEEESESGTSEDEENELEFENTSNGDD